MAQRRLVEIVLQGKDQSKGAFDSLGGSMDGIGAKQLAIAAGAVALAAAAYKAVEALYGFTAEMAAVGDEFDKMHQRTGVMVEDLSAFSFMVERGGGTSADMETAIRRLARAMGDARDNVKESVDAFAMLGISQDQLVGPNGSLREINDILPMIADGIKGMNSQAERMEIAQVLLGRGGTKLLPALQAGAEGFRKMREEIEMYGGAMDSAFSEKSAEFVDAQTNLATATSRLKEAIAEPFMVPFTNAINKFAKAVADAKTSLPGKGEADLTKFYNQVPYAYGEQPLEDVIMNGPAGPEQRDISRPATEGTGPAWVDPRLPQAWVDRNYAEQNEDFTGLEGAFIDDLNADLEHLSAGMVDYSGALKESSAMADMAGALLHSSLTNAFSDVILGAQNFGDALIGIFETTFAQIAGNAAANLVLSAIPGLSPMGMTAGWFDKSVSADNKAMPGAAALHDMGGLSSAAAATYEKAFV